MTKEPTGEYTKAIISGIIVVALSAWAYVLTYFFEYGYLSHFGIPMEFMQIQYLNITTAVLSVILFVYIVLYFGMSINHKKVSATKTILIFWVILFLLVGILPFLVFQDITLKITMLGGVLSIIILMSLDIYRSPGRSIEEKIMSMLTKITGKGPDPVLDLIEKVWGENILMIILMVAYTFYVSFMAGSLLATFKKTYPTFEKNNQILVIVRKYDDSLLALPWVINTHKLGKIIFPLEKISDYGSNGINMQLIGPLQLEE